LGVSGDGHAILLFCAEDRRAFVDFGCVGDDALLASLSTCAAIARMH
jgi:hypothetical protein